MNPILFPQLDERKTFQRVKLLGLLSIACLSVYCLLLDRYALALLIAGCIIGINTLIDPKFGLILSIISVYTADFFQRIDLMPRQFTWLPEVILIFLTAQVIIKAAMDGRIKRGGLEILFALLVFFSLLSAYKENMQLLQILVGLRPYLKPFLLFLVLINLSRHEKDYRGMLFSFWGLFGVSVFLSFFQFFTWGAGDFSGGFLRSGHHGLICISMLFVLVGCMAFYRFRMIYLCAIAFIFLSLLIAEAKAPFFFLPIIFVLLLRNLVRVKFRITLVMLVALSLIFVLSIKYSTYFSGRTTLPFMISSPFSSRELKYALTHEMGSGELNRIPRLLFALSYVSESYDRFLYGIGPGAVSPSYISSVGGQEQLVRLGLFRSQLSKTVMEMGFVGLTIYFLIFSQLYRINRRVFRHTADPYWKAISFGFEGMIFLFLLSTVYNEIWHLDAINYLFWFIAAGICCKANGLFVPMDSE